MVKGLLKPARVSTPDSDKALEMFYTFTDKADHQGLSEFLSFTNGELQSSRPKVISPETRVMSPEIHSHVARNLIMLKKTQVVHFSVVFMEIVNLK